MNKRANRRALFICVIMFFVYIALIFKIPEKVGARRIVHAPHAQPHTMNIALPHAGTDSHSTGHRESSPTESLEPSFLITVPIVCAAMRDTLLDPEGLIFIKKSAYNTPECKKPVEILKDKDEEGLKSILKIIGTQYPFGFLKKEGIAYSKELSAEDIMLGRGYTMSKDKLLSLYSTYVTQVCSSLIPYTARGIVIHHGSMGFELMTGNRVSTQSRGSESTEWIMPNLTNLSLRVAIEKITAHTSHVKVYGSGYVIEQHPKPFERMKGESECVIYGRTDTQ